MNLTKTDLQNHHPWEAAGYALPSYDRETMIEKTKHAPYWIHFGAGNIFRAFQAKVVEQLLNDGTLDRGLIVAESFDTEIIKNIYQTHDNYHLLVTLKSDGNLEKTVIGSVAESLTLESQDKISFNRLKDIFSMDSLQMASFTITEKGYQDFKTIEKITTLLYARFLSGAKPIAMVSMDNCSHNGNKLRDAIIACVKDWCAKELAEKDFLTYVQSPKKVSFPWSMIDKITPRPDASIKALLKTDGLTDISPIITTKGTYIAPFVNAEECEYLVIEDDFPNGRPALEYGGIIFTDRETVDKVEKMKVCTSLNPLHTALAIFGCLLNYDLLSKEMTNPLLKALVERIGYLEGLPVVVNPEIINPKDFLDTVLNTRIPNPYLPDSPWRIATDTSQKIAIRFGETLKAYHVSTELDVNTLVGIPLVLAGWLRYLMGIDDNGISFTPSSDPLLAKLRPFVAGIRLGDSFDAEEKLHTLLSDETLWGIDLYEIGIAERVCNYFTQMTADVGAVAKTLQANL